MNTLEYCYTVKQAMNWRFAHWQTLLHRNY